jgi:hypothetical protein
MQNRFGGPVIGLLISLLCSSALVAQEGGGRGGGRGGRGGGEGAAPAAQGAGRGGRGVAPKCTNDWQTPGCDQRQPAAKVDPHDLTGVWTRTMGGASMGNNVMMTPDGQKRFLANLPSFGPRAVAPALGNDPLGHCDPLGLTRNLFTEIAGRSLEFVQPAHGKFVMQIFEWAHTWRTIWTDGRALPKDAELRWHGYSVGRWEGDTFIVDTIGLDDRTWLDNIGHPHTDEARVEERYRRVDPGTMEMIIKVTDPKTYPQPWVSAPLIHTLNHEINEDEKLDTFCVPSEEEAFNKAIRNPAAATK